jgi:hypothetical protein
MSVFGVTDALDVAVESGFVKTLIGDADAEKPAQTARIDDNQVQQVDETGSLLNLS